MRLIKDKDELNKVIELYKNSIDDQDDEDDQPTKKKKGQ